jgi:hypothetical protein
MSTWHTPDDEDVASCIDYFLTVGWPDDGHLAGWTSARILAAGVSDDAWTTLLRAAEGACV